MNTFYEPGTVVLVKIGLYEHIGIVTDRIINGFQQVISNSARTGSVAEEPICIFSGGRQVNAKSLPSNLDAVTVLMRARAMIGSKYGLLKWNCEHFVRWALGLKVESYQVQTGAAVLAAFLGLYAYTKLK